MKKVLAICLLLMMTISLTACSAINSLITPLPTATPVPTATPTATPAPTATPTATPAPLSKQYETADELVTDIANLKNINSILNALSKNTSIHHFFSKAEADNRIWEKLIKYFSYSNIYCMYAVCNGSSRWFDALNINCLPFAVYGANTKYASGAIPSKDSIISQIKNKFKDPYSVSIPGDMLFFPPTLSNSKSVMYPTPLEFAGWVGVRATNSFGAYGMEGIWIKVSNGKVTFYDSIAVDSEPKDCSLRGFEDTIIRVKE